MYNNIIQNYASFLVLICLDIRFMYIIYKGASVANFHLTDVRTI